MHVNVVRDSTPVQMLNLRAHLDVCGHQCSVWLLSQQQCLSECWCPFSSSQWLCFCVLMPFWPFLFKSYYTVSVFLPACGPHNLTTEHDLLHQWPTAILFFLFEMPLLRHPENLFFFFFYFLFHLFLLQSFQWHSHWNCALGFSLTSHCIQQLT